MKSMFEKFAKIIEVSNKVNDIKNRNTRNYVVSLMDVLVHIGVDIDFIELIVDKCVKQEIYVSEYQIKVLEFFKDRVNMSLSRCEDCEHYVDYEGYNQKYKGTKRCDHPKFECEGENYDFWLAVKSNDFCIYFQKKKKSTNINKEDCGG